MPADTPPRRFAPVPVETTTKSSRTPAKQDAEASKPAPRKFAVEPIETSSKSSKAESQTAPKQALRRFAPEPIESTSRSSRKDGEPSSPSKPKSRFSPQPIETSTTSNRKPAESSAKPRSRFAPMPMETTTRSNRQHPPSTEEAPATESAPSEKPVRRKFAPMLINTSQRSRKADEPTYSINDKTDVIPGVNIPSYHNSGQQIAAPDPPVRPGITGAPRFLSPFERRRDRSNSNSSGRVHSFRMPDLETIESSESEPSNPPSLSSSPSADGSPLTTSDSAISELYKHATRIRESIDEGVANYLLAIEARRAEEKMREQALAAFPNSDYHEPVAHYVDDEEDSDEMEIDDRPATWEGHDEDDEYEGFPKSYSRRRETTHGNWELKEMRKHHEQLEQERNAAKTTARKRSTTKSPWWQPAVQDFESAQDEIRRDPEMKNMRDRARPPMLGNDIRFPRSASPEPARFDVTQGSHRLRHQMCYLTEQSEATESPEGLWGGNLQKASTGHSTKSNSSQGQGLWGGFCVEDEGSKMLAPPTGPTGLMTPRVEAGNPFEASMQQQQIHPSDAHAPVPLPPSIILPLTPPTGEPQSIDGMIKSDQDLDELMEKDYPDTFVTQVYNYLSLGYPSLARPFDEELAKISGVPISELRHDDEIARSMPKGYIRLGQDFEGRGDGTDQELKEGGCARWKALKAYIREWARQEKNMVRSESIGGNWGTGARRGSWAW